MQAGANAWRLVASNQLVATGVCRLVVLRRTRALVASAARRSKNALAIEEDASVASSSGSQDLAQCSGKRSRARAGTQTVLIVESPTKAKKIQGFLGAGYQVILHHPAFLSVPACAPVRAACPFDCHVDRHGRHVAHVNSALMLNHRHLLQVYAKSSSKHALMQPVRSNTRCQFGSWQTYVTNHARQAP